VGLTVSVRGKNRVDESGFCLTTDAERFRSFGFGDGRSRTSRFVGQPVRGSGGTGLEPGNRRVGHHGWLGTGSDLSALLCPSVDAALPEACQGQRLSAGPQTRTRSLLQGSQDLNAIFYVPTQNAARGCLFRAEAAMGPAVSLGRTDHRERSGFLAEEGAAAPAAA